MNLSSETLIFDSVGQLRLVGSVAKKKKKNHMPKYLMLLTLLISVLVLYFFSKMRFVLIICVKTNR